MIDTHSKVVDREERRKQRDAAVTLSRQAVREPRRPLKAAADSSNEASVPVRGSERTTVRRQRAAEEHPSFNTAAFGRSRPVQAARAGALADLNRQLAEGAGGAR